MISTAFSTLSETIPAMKQIKEGIDIQDQGIELLILFVSPEHDLKKVAGELNKFGANNVIACTTSGEISKKGNLDSAITAMAFPNSRYKSRTLDFSNLDLFPEANEQKILSEVKKELQITEKQMGEDARSFGILLIDGLSVKEEKFCGYLGQFLEDIPIVGGSAGDDIKFQETFVFIDGQFCNNSASLTFITTTCSFEIFKHQHFKDTDNKIIITESDAEKRIVREIDGAPAAERYAEILGIKVDDFSPLIFSKYPLTLQIGDEYYVRSIQKVNADGSLTFYCAIDDGLVLTMADKENMHESNESLLNNLEEKLGDIQSCLVFECILRRLEFNEFDEVQKNKINAQYEKYNCVGFHTYGEQFGNVHINQTITGVAFGKK